MIMGRKNLIIRSVSFIVVCLVLEVDSTVGATSL
jgi:hypothetical protein